jgi:hypothetical protein
MAPSAATRAQLFLVTRRGRRWLAAVVAPPDRDLELVDRLLRLHLAVKRQGHRLLLTEVDPDLHDLLALVGVDHLLEERQAGPVAATP